MVKGRERAWAWALVRALVRGIARFAKSLQKWRDFALQFAPIVRSCYLKAVPDCAKVCQN